MTAVHAVCVRGWFGWTASQGLDALCIKLREIEHVTASIWNWTQQSAIVNTLHYSLPKTTKRVYIGYSLGATHGTRYCRLAACDIDCLIGLDPSAPAYSGVKIENVSSNVKKAICFYNPNAWYFGGKKYSPAENIPLTGDVHLGIDWDARCWTRAIHEVQALANA